VSVTPGEIRRAKPIPREAWRQEKAVAFAEAAIMCPHVVMGFDRSRANGQWSHRFEAKRGSKAGTPDTLTIAKIKDDRSLHIWVEWKAIGGMLNDNQEAMAGMLATVGDLVFRCERIVEYFAILRDYSVPMTWGAEVMAMRFDALVDSRIAKAEERKPTTSKRSARRGVKTSRMSVAKAHKLGLWS